MKILSLLICALALPSAVAETFLVKDGQAQAEIVIAEKPLRTVRLAAQEDAS